MSDRRPRQLQKDQLHAFLIENGVIITSSDKKIEWFWRKRGSAFMTDEEELIKDYYPDFLIDTPEKENRVIIVEVDERDHRNQTVKDCMRDFLMHRRSGRNTVTIRISVDPTKDFPKHHMRELMSMIRYYQTVDSLENVVEFLHYNPKRLKEIQTYHDFFKGNILEIRTHREHRDLPMVIINFFNTCIIDVVQDQYAYNPQDIISAFKIWAMMTFGDVFRSVTHDDLIKALDLLEIFKMIMVNGVTHEVRIRHDLIHCILDDHQIQRELSRFDKIEQDYYQRP